MKVLPLKIARPDEVALLEMAGYEVVGRYGATFKLMRLARETSEDAELRKAYALQPHARRFLEPREIGKPPVDPDAEQLAADVVRRCAG